MTLAALVMLAARDTGAYDSAKTKHGIYYGSGSISGGYVGVNTHVDFMDHDDASKDDHVILDLGLDAAAQYFVHWFGIYGYGAIAPVYWNDWEWRGGGRSVHFDTRASVNFGDRTSCPDLTWIWIDEDIEDLTSGGKDRYQCFWGAEIGASTSSYRDDYVPSIDVGVNRSGRGHDSLLFRWFPSDNALGFLFSFGYWSNEEGNFAIYLNTDGAFNLDGSMQLSAGLSMGFGGPFPEYHGGEDKAVEHYTVDAGIDREPDAKKVDAYNECVDMDSDGWCSDQDCNDRDPAINPKAIENRENWIDDDCDGFTDEFGD